jgi:asparagine synthase (glutamine-hydrolysing)
MIPGAVRRGVLGPLGRLYPRSERLPRPLRWKLVLENLGQSFERAYYDDMSLFRGAEKTSLLTPDLLRQTAGHDPFTGFARHFDRVAGADPLSRVLYVDFKTWLAEDILVKVDRMSMACSLEVRAPLLDHHIVEFAASLPSELKLRGSVSKYLLKRHVARRLPALDVHRPKQGFELPLAAWLRGDLRGLAEDLVLGPRAIGRGYVRPERARAIWSAHLAGRRNHAPQLWALMVLELWHRAYIDETPADLGAAACA